MQMSARRPGRCRTVRLPAMPHRDHNRPTSARNYTTVDRLQQTLPGSGPLGCGARVGPQIVQVDDLVRFVLCSEISKQGTVRREGALFFVDAAAKPCSVFKRVLVCIPFDDMIPFAWPATQHNRKGCFAGPNHEQSWGRCCHGRFYHEGTVCVFRSLIGNRVSPKRPV